MLNNNISVGLNIGNPTKIADAIVATGTARVNAFSIIAPPGPHQITYYQKGATVLTLNIEVSPDGGTTWQVATAAAVDLIATKVATFEVYPGVLYRLNVATLTTTPADIFAVLR